MPKYEDLETKQKKLYDNLSDEIKKGAEGGISLILDGVSKGDLQQVLTTANITKKVGGIEYTLTPLAYAMNFNNSKEIIEVILNGIEDKKEVLTTANITGKLGGIEYTLTPLAYAMNFNDSKEIIEVILNEIEDKKEVLTTANITKKVGGIEYTLTPLAYAMNLNDSGEKVKAILDVAEESSILKEVFAVVEEKDRKILKRIVETLKNQAQGEEQETKINCWLEIISSYEGNEQSSKIENSDKHPQKDTVKTFNKLIIISSVCGVIAALAVGGGLFAADVALPILAIIGIVVAAALVTGLVAGGITYAISKPCNELKDAIAQQEIKIELGVQPVK